MKTKRMLTLLLCLCLCISLGLLPVGGARAATLAGAGTEDNPYKIASAADWAALADLAQANETTGKYFLQTADFTTNLMVGSTDHPFQGSYDGGGHTLTFNAESAAETCAPFRFVTNTAISHLRTAGTIKTSRKFSSGLTGTMRGNCTIEDCRSDITIESTVSGDGTHGGFAAYCSTGGTSKFIGCVFAGRLLGPNTTNCGGFVGYSDGKLILTDCLSAPAKLTLGGSSQNFARFNNSSSLTLTHCYYMAGGLSSQGTPVYSVAAGADIALTWPDQGEAITVFNTAGYSIYDDTLTLDRTLFHFGGKDFSMDLTYTGPLGETHTLDITAPEATNVTCTQLAGTSFRLSFTAPKKNLRIGAAVTAPSADYADPLDREDPVKTVEKEIPVIAGDLLELKEDWYLAYGNKTLSDRLRVSGNVNLILADGAMLTAPCGVDVPKGSTLTIWGQSGAYTVPMEGITTLGTGVLTATTGSDQAAAIGSGKNQAAGTIVINGGVINARGNFGAGIGGGDIGTCGAVTIHEGCVVASGNNGSAGIGGGGFTGGGAVTVTGGFVRATGSRYDGTYNGAAWSQAAPGIGSGRPRENGAHLSPGTVTITGGTVVAAAGVPDSTCDKVFGAQAIGVNLADEAQVPANSLVLGTVLVYAPDGEGTPAASADRVKACRNTVSARIEACKEHPLDDKGLCKYCGGLPYHDPTDEKWPEKACHTFTEVTDSTTSFSGGWYAVRSSVKTSSRIRVSGEAHLILVDGAKLEASKGITVPESAGFTVWGQAKGTGLLKSETTGWAWAGIGGKESSSGQVTLNGGTVTAVGGEEAAGIGGGYDGSGQGGSGTVTVNGGTVTATGGLDAAGIGGGRNASGTVTVNGGTVTATGGRSGAGIGGGSFGSGTVTVNGGTVNATGGWLAAGIGGGIKELGTVTVTGGTVNATGGEYAAGVGGGDNGSGTVTVTGGIVNATGGPAAAGVGGGSSGSGTVTVDGGTVTAYGGGGAAGIGGGGAGSGTVTVNSGTVNATGGGYAPGIGSGRNASGTVTVNGGSVTACGGEYATGIGSGYEGDESTVIFHNAARILAGEDEDTARFALAADRAEALKNRWVRIEPCRPHANAGGTCRWCGEGGGLTVTRKGDTLEVKCSLPEEAQVTVTAACYDASGRFLGCTVKDAGARKDFQFNVTAPQSAGKWKIFVTDEKGRPLAEAWEEQAAGNG